MNPSSVRSRAPGARGFTLLELLTVIGIILFMVAVIVGVFVNYQKTLRVKATQKLVERIGVGMSRYYGEFKTYPPDTGFGQPLNTMPGVGTEIVYDPGSIYRYLGQDLVVKDASGTIVRTLPALVKFGQGELRAYTDSTYGASFYVVDSWGTPIGYRGDPKRVVYCRGDVDIFSAGPDKVTAYNNGCTYAAVSGANLAYDGADSDGDTLVDNASELHLGALDGALTGARRSRATGNNDVLDDINNWDPQ